MLYNIRKEKSMSKDDMYENFNDEGKDKNFLSYGTSSKNLYLILLEKGFK